MYHFDELDTKPAKRCSENLKRKGIGGTRTGAHAFPL